jgi:hypothetical protein
MFALIAAETKDEKQYSKRDDREQKKSSRLPLTII